MSVLSKGSSKWDKFWHGDGGYSHALWELAYWGIGWIAMYLITPLIGIAMALFLPKAMDAFWYNRELRQNTSHYQKGHTPKKAKDWRDADAAADVLTPRRFRKYWLIGTAIVALLVFRGVGLTGYLYWKFF